MLSIEKETPDLLILKQFGTGYREIGLGLAIFFLGILAYAMLTIPKQLILAN